MDTSEFQTALARDGFDDIDTRELAAGFFAAEHDHPFDVRAMVLAGQITLTVDGTAKALREGDEFSMAAGCRHEESVGDDGVKFLLGRRHPG